MRIGTKHENSINIENTDIELAFRGAEDNLNIKIKGWDLGKISRFLESVKEETLKVKDVQDNKGIDCSGRYKIKNLSKGKNILKLTLSKA